LQKLQKNLTANDLYLGASISLVSLIFLNIFWEAGLNPIHNKPTWLILKSMVLVVPLIGILKKDRYTFQWSSMLIMIFFIEGVVRFYSEISPSRDFALGQLILSLSFFLCSIFYCKKTR
jgi:uncharacterized membrane protein